MMFSFYHIWHESLFRSQREKVIIETLPDCKPVAVENVGDEKDVKLDSEETVDRVYRIDLKETT